MCSTAPPRTCACSAAAFVALTIPSISNANFADTVHGLSEELAQQGLQVLLGYTDYNLSEEERLVRQLLQRRPEAVVITGGRRTRSHAAPAAELQRPNRRDLGSSGGSGGHVVGFSNAATSRMAVEHLLSEGCRRIAYIGGDTAGDTRGAERRQGFIKTMQAHGMDAHRLIGAGQKASIPMREGTAAMAELLTLHADADAAICVSDLSAFGALTECQRRGIAVPDDIAIAGFGNFEISGVSVPAITTVEPFPIDIGRCAARVITRLLDGDADEESFREEIVPELLPRASTRRSQ